MIEIRHLQPGDICCDAKEILQNRQDATGQNRRSETRPYGSEALPTDHFPVGLAGKFPHQGSNLAKRGGQYPHCNPNVDAGANQPAATAHLNRHVNRDKASDQRNDQKYRDQCARTTMIPTSSQKQPRKGHDSFLATPEHQGRKSVRDRAAEPNCRSIISRRRLGKDDLNRRKLQQQDAKDQGNAGVPPELSGG